MASAGIGTTGIAMRSGRPSLCPVAFDQTDDADVLHHLGFDRVLPFRKVTARRLTSELEALLGAPGYSTMPI